MAGLAVGDCGVAAPVAVPFPCPGSDSVKDCTTTVVGALAGVPPRLPSADAAVEPSAVGGIVSRDWFMPEKSNNVEILFFSALAAVKKKREKEETSNEGGKLSSG